jgi:serine-type D-Ala-D-Ala carboxypeptidase (penicillin-binding protein 5/6)
MIAFSDNTATNLAVDLIGIGRTAELMEQLGFPNTKLHAKVYRGDTSVFPERSKQFGLGSTTANEMVSLLEKLDRGEIVSPEASRQTIDLLYACEDKTMLARDLPDSVKIAHKSGAVTNSRTNAGLIDTASGRIAICVLTTANADQSWGDDNRAHQLIGRIARAAVDFFNPESASEAEPIQLSVGATGRWVQTLQRTLNERLTPSPALSADGDFGPLTESAVMALQGQSGLPETGIVDQATWKALGSLVTSEEVAADPEVVNSQPFERKPLPPLDHPPMVTCQAWAIGDGRSGELLWGHQADKAVHPASTTKIMTAYLIAEMADQTPEVLHEIVTFSANAASTIGSSCQLEAGEQVPVGELLYGLLLPSGNDASVALAEHFGGRALDISQNGSFVAAMNAKAKQLDLKQTKFTNTHGLTDEGHLSSAQDLLVLTARAMQLPEFRMRVAAKRRGCKVTSISGYERNVVWSNTNRLLEYEGVLGVKTGTTKAAGACLVAASERDGREWIVVVLGSASSESRYADAHNLLRWAWQRVSTEEAAVNADH